MRARGLAVSGIALLGRAPLQIITVMVVFAGIQLVLGILLSTYGHAGAGTAFGHLWKGQWAEFDGPDGAETFGKARDFALTAIPTMVLSVVYLRLSVLKIALRGRLGGFLGLGLGVRDLMVMAAMTFRWLSLIAFAFLPLIAIQIVAPDYLTRSAVGVSVWDALLMAAFLVCLFGAVCLYAITAPVLPALLHDGWRGAVGGLQLGWSERRLLIRAYVMVAILAVAVVGSAVHTLETMLDVTLGLRISPKLSVSEIMTLSSIVLTLGAAAVSMIYDLLWAVPGARLYVERLAADDGS